MSLAIWAMETMMAASQENWIKHRAYQLWEQEGYPSGKDMEHWERAKLEYATLKPTATDTDAPKNGASVKTAKATSVKPAKNGAAKATKTAAPKAAKKTEKPATTAKADAKPKIPAAAAAVKPEQTKKRPAKAAAK
jgi:hypothetical protein